MSATCINCGQPSEEGREVDLFLMKVFLCSQCEESECPEEVEIEWSDGSKGTYGPSEKGRR